MSGTSHCSPCNTLSLPPASPCNRCRGTSQVDQAEEQDGSGFLSFSCSNKLKTNEGCVIDLNSKINRMFLSSCMNKSKDLSFMATKNEDQTKYSHLENVKKIHNDFTIIFGKSMVLVENYCEVISG